MHLARTRLLLADVFHNNDDINETTVGAPSGWRIELHQWLQSRPRPLFCHGVQSLLGRTGSSPTAAYAYWHGAAAWQQQAHLSDGDVGDGVTEDGRQGVNQVAMVA